MTFKQWLMRNHACEDARAWVGDMTYVQAYDLAVARLREEAHIGGEDAWGPWGLVTWIRWLFQHVDAPWEFPGCHCTRCLQDPDQRLALVGWLVNSRPDIPGVR